jgi:hypothetical protein
MLRNPRRQDYDFINKNPADILSEDEFEHFEEAMVLKNTAQPADKVDFGTAVRTVVSDLDELLA